jgi:hypothetical protein
LGLDVTNVQWWIEVLLLAIGYGIFVFLVFKTIPVILKTGFSLWLAAGWAIAVF